MDVAESYSCMLSLLTAKDSLVSDVKSTVVLRMLSTWYPELACRNWIMMQPRKPCLTPRTCTNPSLLMGIATFHRIFYTQFTEPCNSWRCMSLANATIDLRMSKPMRGLAGTAYAA